MSTEAALIASCTADPRDTLPRLVYADWLDERSDPRGEMIRVMEEMRLHPVWADEYQRLRPARNRLWKSLDPAWLETMGYQKVYRPLFGTLPEKREHRWRLAEEFIDIWHGGLKEGDGYTDEELDAAEVKIGRQLPKGLREWYRLAGKRKDLWSRQDHLLPPHRIRFDEQRGMIFRVENQNCTRWLVRRSDARRVDPPVYGGDGDRMVADSVSEFALFVLLYEAQFRQCWCELHLSVAERRAALPKRFQRAALPEWYWFSQPIHVWEANDTVVVGDNANDWWYAYCRTEQAFMELVADFGGRVVRL